VQQPVLYLGRNGAERDNRLTLISLANRVRTRPHLARRARLVLLCGDGLASNVVARELHVRDQTVCKWRARFVRARLDGLYDEPRPGAPRTIGDEAVERVLIRTLETTPRGQTHWSVRGMAQATGLSRMTISRIWRAFGLQPHRSETFKTVARSAPDRQGARRGGPVHESA
jgi:transposase